MWPPAGHAATPGVPAGLGNAPVEGLAGDEEAAAHPATASKATTVAARRP